MSDSIIPEQPDRDNEYLDVHEVACMLKFSDGWVRKMCKLGHFRYIGSGQGMMVESRSIDEYAATLPHSGGRPRRPGVDTYFIATTGKEVFVKIGITKDIKARLATLQTASPSPLVCLGVIRGDWEVPLHSHFKKSRLHGEWFSLSRKLESYIRLQFGDLCLGCLGPWG